MVTLALPSRGLRQIELHGAFRVILKSGRRFVFDQKCFADVERSGARLDQNHVLRNFRDARLRGGVVDLDAERRSWVLPAAAPEYTSTP